MESTLDKYAGNYATLFEKLEKKATIQFILDLLGSALPCSTV